MIYNINSTLPGGDGEGFFYNKGSDIKPEWTKLLSSVNMDAYWNLSGNSNIDSTQNFIGTIENQPLNFKVNNDIKITPTLRYSNNALFLIKEDFEQDNDLLKLIFNAKDSFPTYRFANTQSFGDFSGRFLTHHQKKSKVTLRDSIYFKSTENWLIELDYLNKSAVEFGVDVFKNGVWVEYPILLNMPPINSWQKTYFNPMPYLKDAMAEGYFRFYVLVYVNNQTQEIFLDNLNIIKQVD